jgi:hypothetical protein
MQKKSSTTGTNSSKMKEEVKTFEDIELGTTTNGSKIINKRATDPFDKLIFDKGLRVQQILADKDLDTMLILLNNAQALQVPIHHFERLKNASQDDLNKWELTGNGVGIRWGNIDEDLSLKGLIKQSALLSVLHRLERKKNSEELTVL